jgi:hypothetical protein
MLMQRNILRFLPPGVGKPRETRRSARRSRALTVAINGQKLHLFQIHWGIDKIARRNANCGNKRLFGLSYH